MPRRAETVAGSQKVHPLEKASVRHHKHPTIDMELCFESREQPEIEVPNTVRPLTLVSLARSRHRQIRSVHIRNIEGKARLVGAEQPSNRQRVAERRDGQVRFFGAVEVRTTLTVRAPAVGVAFKREDASLVVCTAPMSELEPPARHADDTRSCLHTRRAGDQHQPLETLDVDAAPENDHRTLVTHDARFGGQPMLSAMRTMHAIPVATASRAPRSPFVVATRSSSPAHSPMPELATRTRRARPIALPTPLAVDAMPAATP